MQRPVRKQGCYSGHASRTPVRGLLSDTGVGIPDWRRSGGQTLPQQPWPGAIANESRFDK